jgi:hypothetical protein
MLTRLNTWLFELDEKLGQDLKEYRENQALLQYFDVRISHSIEGGSEYRMLKYETHHKVTGLKIYTIGELVTSEMTIHMSNQDLKDIDRCLKQWDENLHLGMSQPYRPPQ